MILVAYASKTRTAAECAERLAAQLPNAVLCDLVLETRDPAPFDTVLVGGGIRMGALHKAAAGYLKMHESALLEKRLGIFTCNCFAGGETQTLKASVPQSLLHHAQCVQSFGGRMDMSRQHGLDKLICKMASKNLPSGGYKDILPERLARFAEFFLPDA